MALNLSLVAHTAEAESEKLSVQRRSNGFANTRFTHPRRAHEEQNRAINAALESTNGKKLNNPRLYIFQTIVVGVELGARMTKVEIVPT